MELQAAKYLMEMIVQREAMRSDALQLEIEIFTSRVKMKELKRSLNITGDEEDLVTHKSARLDKSLPETSLRNRHQNWQSRLLHQLQQR